jgi:DNA-binding CsgD family transcriptional regulator
VLVTGHEEGGSSAAGADELTALGLDSRAAAAYRVLVGLLDAGVEELAVAGAMSRSDAEVAVADLLARGLALQVAAEGDAEQRVRATPPTLALGPLLADQRGRLVAVENVITRLAADYRSNRSDSDGSPIEVVHGREAVAQRFTQIQLAARHGIEAFVPFQRQGRGIVPVEDNPAEKEAIRRGIRFAIILERAWFDRPDSDALVKDAIAAGQELHIVDKLPLQMVIADRRIAMVPVAPETTTDGTGEPAAAIIHEPGLVEAFRALFAAYRDRGWPLTTGDPDPQPPEADGPDEVDRSILALLNVGLTDVNIARQLGIGPRSVQRRLQRLMGLAGAHSRFQLGGHAVRSGWLPEPGD